MIEVPKISSLLRPPPRRVLPVPQTAEQLVEVPTDPTYVVMVLASKVYSRREIRGFLSGQGSTASGSRVVDNPVPQGRGGGGARGGLQGSRARHNSTANLEQIVDIPARRGLPDFLPGQGSSASSSSRLRDDADEAFTVVFLRKKVRSWARTRGRNCSPSRAHPRGELMRTRMLQSDVVTSL